MNVRTLRLNKVSQHSKIDLRDLSDHDLAETFLAVSIRERHLTVELIDYIREFERRRLYLKLGFTSIYSYMTEHLRYSGTTALSRIDAARLAEYVPTITSDLVSGELNLTQISLLSHALRQKEKECPGETVTTEQKYDLIEKIKGRDLKSSAVIVAAELDLKLKTPEKLRHQKDGSTILEITLSQEQMEQLKRVKDLISHITHDATWAEVIATTTKLYIERKDPLSERQIRKTKKADAVKTAAISAEDRRYIFRRDKVCQREHDGKVCGSTFQLQVDHIVSICDGGTGARENLQLLCGIHNRHKFRERSEAKGHGNEFRDASRDRS